MASPIEEICNDWLVSLESDMRESIHTALGGEQTELEASVNTNISVAPNGNIVLTLSMNDYWQYVDKGRGPTKKNGIGAVRKGVGKDWQTKQNINARTIMIEIYRKSGIKIPKKGLSYDKAAKSLAYLISRKIHKYGFKAKPFYDRVFNDERLRDLANRLAPVMKEEFIIELRK